MPRATKSSESQILNYFRTTPLAVAALVLGLAKDAVRERQAVSEEAKARALKAQRSAAQKKAHKEKPAKPAKKAAPAPVARATATAHPPAKKKRVRPSRAKAARPKPALEDGGYFEEDLSGAQPGD